MVYSVFLSLLVTLILFSMHCLLRTRRTPRKNEAYREFDTETLSRELNSILTDLRKIQKSSALQRREDILKEIDLIEHKLRIIDEHTKRLGNALGESRDVVRRQIGITWGMFSHIRKLLEVEYESLVRRRDTLSEELSRQEKRSVRLEREFQEEYERNIKILRDLQRTYPDELLEKLNVQVSERVRRVEQLEREAGDVRRSGEERIRFLDEVLIRKSAALEAWITSVKRTGENELLHLKAAVDTLAEQVRRLEEQLRDTLRRTKAMCASHEETLSDLRRELREWQNRPNEVKVLVARERYLAAETARIAAALTELRREYRATITRKGGEIRALVHGAAERVAALHHEWREQEHSYRSDIIALMERIRRLQQRRERLERAAERRRRTYERHRRDLEENVRLAREHYETQVANSERAIRAHIRRLEAAGEHLRVRFEALRTRLDRCVLAYDRRIAALERRIAQREQRIRYAIRALNVRRAAVVAALDARAQQIVGALRAARVNAAADASLAEARNAALRERHATFAAEVERLTARVEAARGDAVRLETELHRTEEQVRRRMREVYDIIARKKRDLVRALERLLEAQQVLIVKLPDPPGCAEQATAAGAGVDETEGGPGNPVP